MNSNASRISTVNQWNPARLLIIAFWAAFASACAGTSSDLSPEEESVFSLTAAQSATEAADDRKYLIGAGDVLMVSVWRNPELSLQVPVRPDGYISLPLIGDIKASEQNAEELAGVITESLSSQLRNPQVTVVVTQVNSGVYVSRVRVTGAVRGPLSLPYARGMSVLDVVLEAGGVTELAAPNRARLYRTVDGKLYDVEVKLEDILLRGRLDTNYMLRPGDVLTVPERLF